MKKESGLLRYLKNYKIIISIVLVMFIVVELIGYQYLENISKIVIDDSFSDTGRVQNTGDRKSVV